MPEQITENTSIGKPLLEWTFPEYEKYSRTRTWYIVVGIMGLVFIVYGMLTGNFLFSLIIALFGIILFIQQHQEPHQIVFAITELGIIVGTRFYSYDEITAFYMIYQAGQTQTLFFETKTLVRPLLRVPLQEQNPLDVRFALLEYLPENTEKQEEPMSDVAARNWKIQ